MVTAPTYSAEQRAEGLDEARRHPLRRWRILRAVGRELGYGDDRWRAGAEVLLWGDRAHVSAGGASFLVGREGRRWVASRIYH